MKDKLLNLQMFAEGAGAGAGIGAGSGEGSAEGSGVAADAAGMTTASNGRLMEGDDAGSETLVTSNKGEDRATKFREMIKGEYAEEYNASVQKIIDKRFGETKQLQEESKAVKPILDMLSQKYGVDKADLKALAAAVQEDDSYYEQEAIDRGISVEQRKEIKKIERENAELKAMQAEAERTHQNEVKLQEWLKESEAMKSKYGLANFDFLEELKNPDFYYLMSSGTSVEAAYMATHMDDMLGGAMAHTADAVKTNIAESMKARNGRPPEGALSSKGAAKFGKDVNALTKEERRALEARAARGEVITPDKFGS